MNGAGAGDDRNGIVFATHARDDPHQEEGAIQDQNRCESRGLGEEPAYRSSRKRDHQTNDAKDEPQQKKSKPFEEQEALVIIDGDPRMVSFEKEFNPGIIVERLQVEIRKQCKTFFVVRDDKLEAGTKQRALPFYILQQDPKYDEFLYAGPATGFAQLALAYSCSKLHKKAIVFLSSASGPIPITQFARKTFSTAFKVGGTYRTLRDAEQAAKNYVGSHPSAFLMPFGLDSEDFIEVMREKIVQSLPKDLEEPRRVWIATGSGTLLRTLLKIWKRAEFFPVLVGRNIWEDQFPNEGDWERIHGNQLEKYRAPEKFHERASVLPPFDSLSNYDAKLWQKVLLYGEDGDLIWNVAGNKPFQ